MRAEIVIFGNRGQGGPSGLPQIAAEVTYEMMLCAEDAIEAVFAVERNITFLQSQKISRKKAMAMLLCDMIGAPLLLRDEAESAGARVVTRLRALRAADAAGLQAEARAARKADEDRQVAAVMERVIDLVERRGAVYPGFLPAASTPALVLPAAPTRSPPSVIGNHEVKGFVDRVVASGGSSSRPPRDPLATEFLISRVRELEKQVEDLENKMWEMKNRSESVETTAFTHTRLWFDRTRSAEAAHSLAESNFRLAALCAERLYQGWWMMVETAYGAGWRPPTEPDEEKDVCDHQRFAFFDRGHDCCSGERPKFDWDPTELRDRMEKALEEPCTCLNLRVVGE